MSLKTYFTNEKSDNIYFEKKEKQNAKQAIIFLHGIIGSRRFWPKEFHQLSDNATLYFVDLLGFGYSAKPNVSYTLETHVNALRKFIIKEVKEKKITIVGHSFGAILGLAYAEKYPQNIDKLFLLALPYYNSEKEAIRYATSATTPNFFALDVFPTFVACKLFCFLGGPFTKYLMPYLYKNLPREVAKDALLHSYNSAISSTYNGIYRQNIPALLSHVIKEKTTIIHGTADAMIPEKNIKNLAKKYNLKLEIIAKGSHIFPIEFAKETTDLLKMV